MNHYMWLAGASLVVDCSWRPVENEVKTDSCDNAHTQRMWAET